jgi:hypothetical protein
MMSSTMPMPCRSRLSITCSPFPIAYRACCRCVRANAVSRQCATL